MEEEKSFSQRAFSIYTDIRKLQDKAKTSYTLSTRRLKAELGSDRLLGVPLETYIPSEKLAIESGSADENIEIMKAYMCEQRGIRLIKLPMKGTELDYADSLKRAFQNVHIFISSDTEEDVEIIKNTFERWRDSQ